MLRIPALLATLEPKAVGSPPEVRCRGDHIGARLQIKRRHSDLGKAELVGTIEAASVGKLIGRIVVLAIAIAAMFATEVMTREVSAYALRLMVGGFVAFLIWRGLEILFDLDRD